VAVITVLGDMQTGSIVRRVGIGSSAFLLLVTMTGCGEDAFRGLFSGYTPHERYEQGLREAGLDQTALGADWIAAASAALDGAVPIAAPYSEESYLDPRQVMAAGYRIDLRRGQRITARFESEPDSSYRVFFDMFVMPTGSSRKPTLLVSADSLAREIDYIARRDGDYLIRVQPELLRGGRYSVTIVVGPSLAFPVHGHDTTAIRSWYGDPRDGGRRHHEGLDIFAPRGTPVIAAASGIVRSTRSNRLGGRVVWLRDDLGRSHYYAHLDSHAVARGDRVLEGDTIGFVGNTGNARTTPPHLHFGVYQRGSFDPYPALYQLPTNPALFTGDPNVIGTLVRVNRDRTRVRAQPSPRSRVMTELSLHTPVQVKAGSGGWYRIALPDGTTGFVAASLAEAMDNPIGSEVVASGGVLLTEPGPTAVAMDSVAAGQEVPVLGSFGDFLYVQSPSGRAGWLTFN
jgi:murein DD-endopeptidase MepM/ murein hydrolase activator NlpD